MKLFHKALHVITFVEMGLLKTSISLECVDASYRLTLTCSIKESEAKQRQLCDARG